MDASQNKTGLFIKNKEIKIMAELTNGTTLSVKEGAASLVTLGGVNSIGQLGFGEADEIEVTTLNEPGGYKKYIQGLKDAGTLSIGGFKEPTDAGQAKLVELYASGAVVEWTVSYSDGSSAAFQGFIKKFNFNETTTNGALGWSVDIRISGGVTYSEADGTGD